MKETSNKLSAFARASADRQVTGREGFTLIEVLVVMGIAAILAGLGLVFSLDFYRSYAFNSERDLVVGLIQKARARSMSNINQTYFGVCIKNGSYILFSGACSCDANNSANEVYPAHPSIANSNLVVSFEQLRGRSSFYDVASCNATAATNGSVTLSQYGTAGPATISVNAEGQIQW